MEQVLLTESNSVRVVFHHMPLSIHQWAHEAALGAACAQLQNSKAFWTMHDRLFQEQTSITASNIKVKLLEFAQANSGLRMAGVSNMSR